ncbi:hypothetical protein ACFQI3_14410 [Hansschlegelia quercus]|uniref:Uncharacterized protein n=1 Tax=Hansschlegelia quercus TaxID=2528245 RepID=A0A4Q9GBG1_9HYPH|nr:hypothetical protein [Hansschlegelia quercus]TBN48611.1 hypothetical protein EYR15_13545 [Hansschlegelia quercus]
MDAPDLFVVSSPLQYLNAAELAVGSDRPPDLVLIGDRAGAADGALMLAKRDRRLWGRLLSHPGRPQPSRWLPRFGRDLLDAGHRISLERLAASLGSRGRVVFGDYRHVSQRALIAGVECDELVLLDDGSVAPQVAAFRAGEHVADFARFAPGWLRTELGRATLGEKAPKAPERLTYFTIYGRLMRRLKEADGVSSHAYERLRSLGPRAPRGDEVWLIGSNHVDAGICAPASYRALIRDGAAALRAEGKTRLVYRPHRGESLDAARRLAAEIGAVFAPSPTPVELAYVEAPLRPAGIAVVASTSADTLSIIDPELEIIRFALPETYLERQQGHIEAVIAGHDAFNPRLRVLDVSAAPRHTQER